MEVRMAPFTIIPNDLIGDFLSLTLATLGFETLEKELCFQKMHTFPRGNIKSSIKL
jgi:hypothetical protein